LLSSSVVHFSSVSASLASVFASLDISSSISTSILWEAHRTSDDFGDGLVLNPELLTCSVILSISF